MTEAAPAQDTVDPATEPNDEWAAQPAAPAPTAVTEPTDQPEAVNTDLTAGQRELIAQAEALEAKAADAHKQSLELARAARALRRASDSLAVQPA